jgi:hypothetical protein
MKLKKAFNWPQNNQFSLEPKKSKEVHLRKSENILVPNLKENTYHGETDFIYTDPYLFTGLWAIVGNFPPHSMARTQSVRVCRT